MNNFIDVVLPPFLLLVFGSLLCGTAIALTIGRLRLYAAKRSRIRGVKQALSEARDIMACLVADPGLEQGIRDKALASYEALGKALTSEKDPT